MSLRDQLLAVRDSAGELTPRVLVAAATPKSHPLHGQFEWDNKIAGDAYRIVQARELIRSVGIIYEGTGGPTTVRGFLNVNRGDAGNEYVPTEEVLDDPFTRQLVLKSMEREWQTFKRRYEHLAEFAALLTQDQQAG